MDDRMMPPNTGYAYSPIRVIVEKVSEQGNIYVGSIYSQKFRNTDLDLKMNEGMYVVSVIANWVGKEYDYFLSFYGNREIRFKRVYVKHIPNAVSYPFAELAKDLGRKVTKGTVNEFTYHHEASNLVIITAENSGDRSCDHNCDLSKVDFKNLHLVNAKCQDDQFHDKSKKELA